MRLHRSGAHQMFSAKSDIRDSEGNVLVTSYAVKRPDLSWSLLLINKDENNPHTVRVILEDAKSKKQGTLFRLFRALRLSCATFPTINTSSGFSRI